MWSPTENGTTLNYTYNTKSYTVTEMPLLVDLSPSVGGGGTVTTKKVLVVLDDTNKVGSKTTHELTLATGDEIWVNGVQTTSDIQIVVKRAVNPIAAVAPVTSGLNGTVSSNGTSSSNGAVSSNGTNSSNGTSSSTPNGLPPSLAPIPTGAPPIAPVQKVTTTVTKKMSLL
jgi:hypothetical protein